MASPAEFVTHNLALPFVDTIRGGLNAGRAIVIKGSVLDSSDCDRFRVDLCCGLLIQGDHQDNKALHFNPRFEKNKGWFSGPPDRQIVINSLINNRWGVEERYANTINEDEPFTMRILVLSEYYKIAINGRHVCDYLHRIPISEVKTIYIAGNVKIDAIEYQGDICTPTVPVHQPLPKHQTTKEIINKPTIPFKLRLKQHLEIGMVFSITGTPHMHAERFCINFIGASGEYFFHLRVDFPRSSKEKGAVVRNATRKFEWQEEERSMSQFPFKPGLTFDAVFKIEKKFINITFDGSQFASFSNRSYMNMEDVDCITIVGDLTLLNVCLK